MQYLTLIIQEGENKYEKSINHYRCKYNTQFKDMEQLTVT